MERFNPVIPSPLKPETLTNSLESFSKESAKPKTYFIDESSSNSLMGGPGYTAGGPQFGESDGWGRKLKNWLGRYGSSVVLPIIAILILAGGIYLYATRNTEELPAPTAGITDELIDEISEPTGEVPKEIAEAPKEKTEEPAQKPEIKEIIPEPVKKEGKIIEKAVRGDGVTHLARRALKDYLKDKPQEKELTKEHKIYIEDYLKDKESSHPVEIGDEIAFGEDLIKEAINASLGLTQSQLKNIEKYSALVTNF